MGQGAEPVVGVLALQGDFADHQRALEAQGLASRPVRSAPELADLDGLVLPGGESTTMLRLLETEGLEEPLVAVLASGLPVLGTCAGLILLAAEVRDPAQRCLGLLPIAVERNGYGRQFHSGTIAIEGPGVPEGTEGVFIRAPRIVAVGEGCAVLARRGPDPVLVAKGPILGCCFHPELVLDHQVFRCFAELVRQKARPPRLHRRE